MQSRRISLLESCVSTAIGYLVAVVTNAVVLPLFGFHGSAGDHALIAAIFTVVSVVRGYLVRRLFA